MPRGIRGQQIADESLESQDIKDGTIVDADISPTAEISQSKITQSSGWISELESGSIINTVDTSSGNVDGSSLIPTGQDNGKRWLVINSGANEVYNLHWDITIQSGKSMEFVYVDGDWIPTFPGYNHVRKDWVEVWSGQMTVVDNEWGSGLYQLSCRYNSSSNSTMSMIINTVNYGTSLTDYSMDYTGGSTGDRVVVRHSGTSPKFTYGGGGSYSSGSISKIYKWQDVSYTPAQYPVADGWELLFDSIGNTSDITNQWGLGYYKAVIRRTDGAATITSEIEIPFLDVDHHGSLSSPGSSATSNNGKLRYIGSSNKFSAEYSFSGTWYIIKLYKWNGIMSVKHDYKQILSGTAFPVSPSFGDECYREDLDEWYKYNGSTWTQI
jgi:hypothetical protein